MFSTQRRLACTPGTGYLSQNGGGVISLASSKSGVIPSTISKFETIGPTLGSLCTYHIITLHVHTRVTLKGLRAHSRGPYF